MSVQSIYVVHLSSGCELKASDPTSLKRSPLSLNSCAREWRRRVFCDDTGEMRSVSPVCEFYPLEW